MGERARVPKISVADQEEQKALVDADLDTHATALYVGTDDLLKAVPELASCGAGWTDVSSSWCCVSASASRGTRHEPGLRELRPAPTQQSRFTKSDAEQNPTRPGSS